MSKADRRDSYRLSVEAGQATLRSAEGLELRVQDLSGSGISLLVPTELVPALQERPSLLQLGTNSHAVRLDLVRLIPEKDGLLNVGAKFRNLGADGLRQLANFLLGGFAQRDHRIERLLRAENVIRWKEPRMIRRLLHLHAIHRKLPIRPHVHATPLPVWLRCEEVERDGTLIVEIDGADADYLELGHPFTFLLAGGESVFFFESSPIGFAANHRLRLSPPRELNQAGFRVSPRPRVADELELPISFADPMHGRTVEKRLIDVGARGLSFECDLDEALVFPGSKINARVGLEDREVAVSGIVRRVLKAGSTAECGLEFVDFADRSGRRTWHEFVVRQANPRLEFTSPKTAGKAWHILTAAEYTKLWTRRRDRAHLARSFSNAWFKMSERFGQVMVANDDVRSVGTAAANLIYPKTWMIHHLGVDRGERTIKQRLEFRSLTRQLYFASMYLINHVYSAEYFVLYVEENKIWNQRMYRGFIDQYSAARESLYGSLQVFRSDPQRLSLLGAPKFQISENDARGTKALEEHLAKNLSALEVDAFDYSPSKLRLADFERECAAEGYERGRRLLFATRDGEPVAAVIAELGSEGVNLFGLLNTCRFFELAPGGADAKAELVLGAARIYRQAHKKTFLFFDDTRSIDPSLTEIGLEHVSPGVRWLVRKEVAPAWLGYVDEMLRISI